MKSKYEIIIDLSAMLQSFRYAIYSLKFTEHFKKDIHRIDVISLSNKKEEIIFGKEFSDLLSTHNGREYLLGNTSALLKSNLIISSYERAKGYSLNSSTLNYKKFMLKENHNFENLLQIFHLVRGVTAHWNINDNLKWKNNYPDKIQYRNLTLIRGMKCSEIVGDNENVQSMMIGLIDFVKSELD